jgi:integrase
VPIGEDVVARLGPLVAGRSGHEMLLTRASSRRIGNSLEWGFAGRAPWSEASAMLGNWRKALGVAGVPYVEPYALRHSAIVRLLRLGVPVRIVGALCDTSSAMIERHYASHILDLSDELARRGIVPLVTPPPSPLKSVG